MDKQSIKCPHCGSTDLLFDIVYDFNVCQNCGGKDSALVWHLPRLKDPPRKKDE